MPVRSTAESGSRGGAGDGTVDIDAHEFAPKAAAGPEGAEPWGWRRGQRIGLGVLLVLMLGFLVIQYARHPYRLNEPLTVRHGEGLEFEAQLDPNTADVASLARLPRVSEKVAQAIVEYREGHRTAERPMVFQTMEDLQEVSVGSRSRISKETLKAIRPYVKLPGDGRELMRAGLKPYARVAETQGDLPGGGEDR